MKNPVVIDYLAFTVVNDSETDLVGPAKALHDFLVNFCAAHGSPLESYTGGHMYTKGYMSFSGFRTYYGGPYTGKTMYLQISGDGCALIGACYKGGLLAFLRYLFKFQVRITRIDLAADEICDDPSQACLTHERLFHCWMNELKVGAADKWDLNAGRAGGEFSSFCMYVGKRKSDCFMRIYDKKAEQHDADRAHWFRCELELHREKAQQVYNLIVGFPDFEKRLEELYCGLCLNHVRFIKSRNSNISRSDTCEWWTEFLDGCTVTWQLASEYHDTTVYDVAAWIDKAVLGAWITIEKTFGPEFLRTLKADYIAMDRLPASKKRMIFDFKNEEKRHYDECRECSESISTGAEPEEQQPEDVELL